MQKKADLSKWFTYSPMNGKIPEGLRDTHWKVGVANLWSASDRVRGFVYSNPRVSTKETWGRNKFNSQTNFLRQSHTVRKTDKIMSTGAGTLRAKEMELPDENEAPVEKHSHIPLSYTFEYWWNQQKKLQHCEMSLFLPAPTSPAATYFLLKFGHANFTSNEQPKRTVVSIQIFFF